MITDLIKVVLPEALGPVIMIFLSIVFLVIILIASGTSRGIVGRQFTAVTSKDNYYESIGQGNVASGHVFIRAYNSVGTNCGVACAVYYGQGYIDDSNGSWNNALGTSTIDAFGGICNIY